MKLYVPVIPDCILLVGVVTSRLRMNGQMLRLVVPEQCDHSEDTGCETGLRGIKCGS